MIVSSVQLQLHSCSSHAAEVQPRLDKPPHCPCAGFPPDNDLNQPNKASVFHSYASLLCCSLRIPPTFPAKLMSTCVTAEWRKTGLTGAKWDAFPEHKLIKRSCCWLFLSWASLAYIHQTTSCCTLTSPFYICTSHRMCALQQRRSLCLCPSPPEINTLLLNFWTSAWSLCHKTQIRSGCCCASGRLSIHPSCCSSEDGPGKACCLGKSRSWTVCAKRAS